MQKSEYLAALHQSWSGCQGCMLSQERRMVVFGCGNPDAQVMIVGEAPGENEDKYGVPFIGNAGMLLDQYLGLVSAREDVIEAYQAVTSKARLSEQQRNDWRIRLRDLLMQDYYFTNIVMCRPPENRDPTPKEIAACRTRLLEQIYTVDPVYIVTAGKLATEALVGKKVSILSVHGELFDVEFEGRGVIFRYPVMPILHPAYLLRKNDFLQAGGDAQKTRDNLLRLMYRLDEYNFRHYGTPKPKARPKMGR